MNPISLPGSLMIEPRDRVRNPALLVVDMQNDFVRVGAALEVVDARATIPANKALIDFFRARKLPVVYTKFITFPAHVLLWEWSPQALPPTKCCWKGHRRHYPDIGREQECTAVIDELEPLPGEQQVEKFNYGAFHATTLEPILRSMGVESVVVTGTVTQICVEETARQAFHHGFRTTLVRDAVSSFAPDLHAATLKNFASKFGWVEDSAAIMRVLD
jgi:nicotinamidase-related amidase